MELPKVGYGTWMVSQEDAERLTLVAIDSGYKHIDTANIYRNEYQIGQAIKKSKKRKELFITTKIWPFDYNDAYNQLLETLKRINLDKIDLILLHAPNSNSFNIKAYKDLQKARKEGLVSHIGVSNFSVKQIKALYEATGEYPYANQILLSPTSRWQAVESFCKKQGIKLIGYSILRSYFNTNPLFKKQAMNNLQREQVANLAKKYKKDVGQILSRWALQSGYAVIPKSSKPKRIISNHQINDFEIDKKDMATLNSWNKSSNAYFQRTMFKFRFMTILSRLFKRRLKK